jgi:long-chain-fatty-acid--[acyl-carrier-protein] ligase
MMHALRRIVWAVIRLLLSLRYRVRVRGLGSLDGLTPGRPVLVLPNHPGYIDPPLVLSSLYSRLRPRPMVFEGVFQNLFLYPFLILLDALRVPDLETASADARAAAQNAVQGLIDGLKAGQNHILWPSGRIQRRGLEILGGARGLTDILAAVPEAEIVLVRTRGVWGSRFSYAQTGQHPGLGGSAVAGVRDVLLNLLFFTPRRDIEITVERLDRTKLPPLERIAINGFFERWYNADTDGKPETPKYVPYHFLFGPRTFEFPKLGGLADADLSQVKPETKSAVEHILSDKLGRPLTAEEKRPETSLDQLGLDSLDRMEISLKVEHQFGFSGDQVPADVGQLWALAAGLAEKGPPKPPPEEWFRRPSDTGPAVLLGETVPEAFIARALANRKDVAVADDLAGVLSYERMLVGVLTMSKRLAGIAAPNVGLMLPASAASDIAFLALHLAGKLPVVLNWTTGPANLAHAAKVMGLSHVVTSKKFLDRSGVSVEGVKYLFLEELRAGISKFELLTTLLRVRWMPGGIRSRTPRPAPDSPAVVLFTSGSEKAPKAVPLTHRNILSDQRSGLPALGLTRGDSMLGFLPAFHSFGMNVTGLAPLLNGIKVVHHPDPTDAAGLARKIAGYRPTVLCATPTFVSYILDRAKPGELHSLRMVIVGAEKCPQSVFDRVKAAAPDAMVLEGYGITECAPVVSVNTPTHHRQGTVGKPLPGVEVRAVDLDSIESPAPAALPAGSGKMGMLLVAGPTIFPGYLGYDGPSPFKELDGKRWYVTGDLAELDADGFIKFGGRLKRFLKAGGEMISLPALEEPFARMFPPTQDGPRVAVEGVETEGGGRRVVLFTTEALTLKEANAKLWDEGFRGVMRLDEVRRIEKLPLLGTGKTDYKVLRAQILSQPAAASAPAAMPTPEAGPLAGTPPPAATPTATPTTPVPAEPATASSSAAGGS